MFRRNSQYFTLPGMLTTYFTNTIFLHRHILSPVRIYRFQGVRLVVIILQHVGLYLNSVIND